MESVEVFGDDNLDNIVPLQVEHKLNGGKYMIAKYVGSENGALTYVGVKNNGKEIIGIRELFDSTLYHRGANNRLFPLHPNLDANKLNNAKSRFDAEAGSIESKDYSHRLNVIDTFDENGTQYYVFEFKGGVSLQDIYRLKGHFSFESQPLVEDIPQEIYTRKALIKVLAIIVAMLIVVVGTWLYARHWHEVNPSKPSVIARVAK